MNTLTQNPEHLEGLEKRNKLLFAELIFLGLIVGWLFGTFSTKTFSTSKENNKFDLKRETTFVPSMSINGESLPTIILNEFSIAASKK